MQNASTTYRHIEQAVRYLSMIADMAAEKANEGIAVVDLNGSLLFLNEAWCGMHGYKSKDELIGKQLSIFHNKEQMKTGVIPLLAKTMHCGQAEGTIGHIKSNGAVFVTQNEMISVRDDTGKTAGFIVFAANNSQSRKLKDTTDDNLKHVKRLSERIAQLRKLFSEFRQIGICLAEQTNELRVNNEMLLKQISELDQPSLIPKQNSEQIQPRKALRPIVSKRPVDVKPERRQPKEAPTKSSKPIVKSGKSSKKFDSKEFAKVLELARRLSEFSKHNIQNEYKDKMAGLKRCSTKTKETKPNEILLKLIEA